MELVDDTGETRTIRFTRQEVARLMSLLLAARVDFKGLDSELLQMSEDELDKLTDDFFACR